MEVFKRGGEDKMDEYRTLVHSAQAELRRLIGYAKVAEGTADVGADLYDKMYKRFASRSRLEAQLEEIYRNSRA